MVVEQVGQWRESLSIVGVQTAKGIREQREDGSKELLLVHMEDTTGAQKGLERGDSGCMAGVKEAICQREKSGKADVVQTETSEGLTEGVD